MPAKVSANPGDMKFSKTRIIRCGGKGPYYCGTSEKTSVKFGPGSTVVRDGVIQQVIPPPRFIFKKGFAYSVDELQKQLAAKGATMELKDVAARVKYAVSRAVFLEEFDYIRRYEGEEIANLAQGAQESAKEIADLRQANKSLAEDKKALSGEKKQLQEELVVLKKGK